MTVKVTLATGKDSQFEIELPFKSVRELEAARKKFKLENFPDKVGNSPVYEFYLQFLPDGTTIDDIKPDKGMSLKKFVNIYGLEDGTVKYNNWKEKQAQKGKLTWFINKYGEEDGNKRYIEKNSRLSVGVEALRKNGKTEEEILQIKHTHGSKSARTLENFVNSYGEEEGIQRFTDYIENHYTYTSVKYWVKQGMTEEEAKAHISKIQKRDINHFIDKYGEKEGLERYLKANELKIRNSKGFSGIEIEVYEYIKTIFPDTVSQFRVKHISRPIGYLSDIYIPEINLIIEVFGDYFHCHPKFWGPDDYNKTIQLTAQERWNKDKIRVKDIRESGYNIEILWECDIHDDFFGLIHKTIDKYTTK